MVVIPKRVAARVLAYTAPGPSGCLLSLYSVASHGYAQVGWVEDGVRTMTTAHRAAWVGHNSRQVPEGMTVDHLCNVRTCVNGRHLRLLTNRDNARRTRGRDWPLGQCVEGHPDADWVSAPSKGYCRSCRRARDRARRLGLALVN